MNPKIARTSHQANPQTWTHLAIKDKIALHCVTLRPCAVLNLLSVITQRIGAAPQKHLRILLGEDDARLVVKFLAPNEVEAAIDGRREIAVDRIIPNSANTVFVDINLAGCAGIAVCSTW